jgi:MFS transporter, DHA2 family, multidrug resistance protein
MSAAAAEARPTPPSAPAAVWKPKRNPWIIAITVTLATFMEVLDTSIANVALPHIAGGLGASQDEATWVLTSYLVANAVILPASAYFTTFIGRKKFYMICVALFGISSALCGLAPSLPLLIFCRVLQGVGGGGLAPSEQAILADTFEPAKRGQAFALYGLAVVFAPAIGPTLGGWITDNFDWRWIFFINVPVAILSLFLTSRIVEDPPHIVKEVKRTQKEGLKLDFIGFGLLALGFGSLELIMDKGQEDDWFGSRVIATFAVVCAVALVSLVAWEVHEIRAKKRPILDLTLFKHRNFAVSFVLMGILGTVLFGTTVLIPQFVQSLLGYTAELAGLVISPGGVMVMLMMPIVGFLVSRVDPRWMIVYGFTISSIALFTMLDLNTGASYGHIAMLRVFQAAGLAFLFIPINMLSYTGIPGNKNNDVSGLTNLARNIGGSMGTAFVVTILARRQQFHQERLGGNVALSSMNLQSRLDGLGRYLAQHGGKVASLAQGRAMAQGTLYQQLVQQSTMLAYLDVIKLLAIAMALAIPLVFLMQRPPRGGGPVGH